MITKNKQSPATLYLLNAKNATKLQEQRKSARLSFNKKKSSRSISQYQKWNANKDNNNAPFQPTSRTNSQIKRIVLSKNQFGLQSLAVQKKLNSILQIFGNKKRQSTQPQSIQKDQNKKKSQEGRSNQLSLLSLKDTNDKEKYSKSRKISHVRTQSMLNHTDYENSIEQVLIKIDRKFKDYEKCSEDWKLKYMTDENDYLLDDMLRIFKALFNQVTTQFSNHIVSNIQYFEDALTTVAKQYQIQISSLKEELNKANQTTNIISNLMKTLNEKHSKGIVCSKILQDIQKKGINVQDLVKQSEIYQQIMNIQQKHAKLTFQNKFSLQKDNPIQNISKIEKSCSDQDFYEQEKLDYVQNDSNWNDRFQNRQSIKGVLKYIHNHNQNKEKQMKANLNSTGSLSSAKIDKNNMKIDNWKNFDSNSKSISNYKKIMSQR